MGSVHSTSDKRKIYLINHDPIEHLGRIQTIHALGKFVVEQTSREFRAAAYNDGVIGELFSEEEHAKSRLYSDEYYLELLVPAEAISEITSSDRVIIKSGFTPVILSLKTAHEKTYVYDQEKKVFHRERESRGLSQALMRKSLSKSSAQSKQWQEHYHHAALLR